MADLRVRHFFFDCLAGVDRWYIKLSLFNFPSMKPIRIGAIEMFF